MNGHRQFEPSGPKSATERNRSRGRALRQAARSTRPVLTMKSGNLTQDRSNCMTDKTRSPDAWAHDRRQDDWAITPKIQQATSAPPKIRMTKPVRSDRTPAILTSGSKQFRLDRVEVL